METKTRVAGIIIQNQKLLMLKGSGFKELWTPGGKIENNESDHNCLNREINEELQVKLDKMKFFGEYSGPSIYHPNRLTIQRVYIISIVGDPRPSSEIESLFWLSKNDFEKRKYPMVPITEKEIIPDLIKQKIF